MRNKTLSTIAVSAVAILAAAPDAAAAPQILGLVASAEPVPLTCAKGVCTAELTTVCLQEYRRAPMPGTAYRASDRTRITLNIGPRPSATDVTARISFRALRNISSVAISLPESVVREAGFGAASVSVGDMASVVPVAVPHDPQPQSTREIAEFTGPLRSVAGRVFERERVTVGTLHALNQVINRMPAGGGDDLAAFETVWREVVEDRAATLPAEVRRQSSRAADTCRTEIGHGMLPSMRSCIADQHDALAAETTKKVWKALKPNG